MKKILMTMVALLSMTAMTAQTTDGERKAPKKMTHEEVTTQMTSWLKLTDAQKTKVAALNKEYQDYLMPEPPQKPEGETGSNGDKAKQKKAGNKKQGNGTHQAKRQEYEKKLKTILSDDQYKSYQKMEPQGKGKGLKDKKQSKK